MRMRCVIAAAALILAACGGGSGEGLDEKGRPIQPGAGPTAIALTLGSIQANVFTVNCEFSGCHGGGTVQAGLRLDPDDRPLWRAAVSRALMFNSHPSPSARIAW